jgi:hypothetical protein
MSDPLFNYCETLSTTELLKIPDSINLSKTKNYEAVIFRLLSGSACIQHIPSGKFIKPNKYYYDLSAKKINNFNKRVSDNISPCNMDILGAHFKENIGKNYTFYQELFHEFACYFYQVSDYRKNYSGGFIHLYRILESIAYVFPIMWASKAKDGYYGTFDKLRNMFNDPARGELAILKIFLNGFISPEELAIPIKIYIRSCNQKWLKGYFKVIEDNIGENGILDSLEPGLTADSMPETVYIKIKAIALLDLTVNIRNKYFHFLTGKNQSIKTDQVADPEEFFQTINEQILTWLSYIFLKILLYEVGY